MSREPYAKMDEAQKSNEAVIKQLVEHYLNNVLEVEPDEKCEKLKERLWHDPNAKKLIVEGLSKSHECVEAVQESDLCEAELSELESAFRKKYGFDMPHMIALEISNDKVSRVAEKIGLGETFAFYIRRCDFERGSPFYGTNVTFVSNDKTISEVGGEHEALHILHNECSRPMRELSDYANKIYADGNEKEKYCKLSSLLTEMDLLSELLACQSEYGKEEFIKKVLSEFSSSRKYCPFPATSKNFRTDRLKTSHIPRFAERYAEKVSETGIIPPGSGIFGGHGAKAVVKEAMRHYLEEKVDVGFDALEILMTNLPASKVTKIMLSCGLTKKEFESGNYTRPVKELAEWAEDGNYEKVLASIPENVR